MIGVFSDGFAVVDFCESYAAKADRKSKFGGNMIESVSYTYR